VPEDKRKEDRFEESLLLFFSLLFAFFFTYRRMPICEGRKGEKHFAFKTLKFLISLSIFANGRPQVEWKTSLPHFLKIKPKKFC